MNLFNAYYTLLVFASLAALVVFFAIQSSPALRSAPRTATLTGY